MTFTEMVQPVVEGTPESSTLPSNISAQLAADIRGHIADTAYTTEARLQPWVLNDFSQYLEKARGDYKLAVDCYRETLGQQPSNYVLQLAQEAREMGGDEAAKGIVSYLFSRRSDGTELFSTDTIFNAVWGDQEAVQELKAGFKGSGYEDALEAATNYNNDYLQALQGTRYEGTTITVDAQTPLTRLLREIEEEEARKLLLAAFQKAQKAESLLQEISIMTAPNTDEAPAAHPLLTEMLSDVRKQEIGLRAMEEEDENPDAALVRFAVIRSVAAQEALNEALQGQQTQSNPLPLAA